MGLFYSQPLPRGAVDRTAERETVRRADNMCGCFFVPFFLFSEKDLIIL
jgi:hypothetical protein